MTDYEKMTDAFEGYYFDNSTFTHEHHVGVAYEMLTRHGFLDAVWKYTDVIRTVATNHGAGDKFNMTITMAFLSIMAERMHETSYESAQAFIAENQDLIKQNPLARLYSKERLGSAEARRVFLLPDLAPLSAARMEVR